MKKEYTIHYHIDVGWSTVVVSECEEDALELAWEEFEQTTWEDYNVGDVVEEGVTNVVELYNPLDYVGRDHNSDLGVTA
jgi:tRNA A58 N-methylase Trm61